MNELTKQALSKVPAVTLGFWIIKILATTLGETGGDTVTMTLNWGYSAGAWLFGGVLVLLVVAQIFAKRFNPILYWATIVASTTFGTALADFADRSLGIGYTGGSLLLLCLLLVTLGIWYRSQGTVSVNTVATPKGEAFYCLTITFSQTLGTALGDWLADTGGLGYEGGALVFSAGLVAIAALYYWTRVSRVILFWLAFILTRPLGATVGDFLDKPVSHGGLDLSRPLASAVIAGLIVALLVILPQRPGQHPGGTAAGRASRAKSVGGVHLRQSTEAAAAERDVSLREGGEGLRDDTAAGRCKVETSSSRNTAAKSLASSRSAVISLRIIFSGLCRFLV